MHTPTRGICKRLSTGEQGTWGQMCTLLSPFRSKEAAGKGGPTASRVRSTPQGSGICRPSPARSLGAEAGRQARRAPPATARSRAAAGGRRFPYLEVLEEGGDARDLQAEAPGRAARALDAHGRQGLVQPPSRRGAGAAGQAAPAGQQPEADGQGRAGRPGLHGCGSGARARGAGRGSQLRAGAALPGTSRPPQLRWKVQSFNSSPAPSPPTSSRLCLEGWGEADRPPRHWLRGE